jgi:hypothetical protein
MPHASAPENLRPGADQVLLCDLNVARYGHTLTALKGGQVLVLGGRNDSGPVAAAESLNTRSGRVDIIASMLEARSDHAAAVMADGRVLVAGGFGLRGQLDSTEIFDPATHSFTPGPKLVRSRVGPTLTVLDDGRILVAGGAFRDCAEIIDPNTGASTLLAATMQAERGMHGAVLMGNGKVLLAGGLGADTKELNTAEVFDPAKGTFSPVYGAMVTGRVRPEFHLLHDGKVQVIGGDRFGSMEVFSPKGAYFRGFTTLNAAAEGFSNAELLKAQTRSILVQGLMDDFRGPRSAPGMSPGAAAAMLDPGRQGAILLEREVYKQNFARLAEALKIPEGKVGKPAPATYYSVDLADTGQTVICPRDARKGGALVLSLSTDRIDYGPEGRPSIEGAGWIPNEAIQIIRHSVVTGKRDVIQVEANDWGRFEYSGLKPSDHLVGAYILTATGALSGDVAQTVYQSCPAFDPAHKGEKPVHFYIPNIPLAEAYNGVIQTPGGPVTMNITPQPSVQRPSSRTASAPQSAAYNSGYQSFYVAEFNPFDIPPVGPITTNFILKNLEGHVQVSGSFDAFGSVDWGSISVPDICGDPCCWTGFCCGEVCIPNPDPTSWSIRWPSFSAGISCSNDFSAGLATDVQLKGIVPGLRQTKELVPLYGVTFGSGSFTFTCALAISISVDVEITKAMTYHLGAGFDLQDVGLSLALSTSDPYASASTSGSGSGNGSFRVIDLGTTRLTLGLNLGLDAKMGPEDGCPFIEAHLWPVSVFLRETIAGAGFGTACETYDFSTTWGLRFYSYIKPACRVDFGALGTVNIVPPGTSATYQHDYVEYPIWTSAARVFEDTGAPVISNLPANINKSTDPGSPTAVTTWTAPSASDSCSGLQSLVTNYPSGYAFPVGTTAVTYTATDRASTTDSQSSSNTTSATFTVTVRDTEFPVVHDLPANIEMSTDPGRNTAVTTWPAITATDNYGVKTLTVTPPSGFAFPMGVNTVTVVATDNADIPAWPGGHPNVTTRTFTVTVRDHEAPLINRPATTFRTPSPYDRSTFDVLVDYLPTDNDRVQENHLTVAPVNGSRMSAVQILDPHRIRLTDVRRGLQYLVTIYVTDPSGNQSSRDLLITVPADAPRL